MLLEMGFEISINLANVVVECVSYSLLEMGFERSINLVNVCFSIEFGKLLAQA